MQCRERVDSRNGGEWRSKGKVAVSKYCNRELERWETFCQIQQLILMLTIGVRL